VGPWYVLPDEFLVSGESLIRNLMLGRRISSQFGRTMEVGYVPDPFGHIAQLPQILQGFGLDTFVFSRGIDTQADPELKIEFEWRAPDGTGVLALHQRFFYNNATFLGYRIGWGDPEGMVFRQAEATERLRRATESLRAHARTPHLLLNNGVDHAEHQKDLPAILRRAAKELPEYRFEIASFEDYAKAVRRSLNGQRLQRRQGELIYRYGDMLHGVYSARMYLKTANRACQDLLEKEAEPLAALAWAMKAASYPQDPLWYAWRTLLQNHPHDDICGCSCDGVHRDMEYRFRTVETVGRFIGRESLRAIARDVDTTGGDGTPILVFNPLGHRRDEVVDIAVDLEPGVQDFELVDEAGRAVPYERLGSGRLYWMEPLKGFKVQRHTVRLRLELPPVGYRTLYAREGKAKPVKAAVQASARGFENGFYKLSIADDGSLRYRDKRSGREFKDLLVFEETEDCGDEYNWSYLPENSQTLTTAGARAEVSLVHSGPFGATWRIVHRMRVPKGLTEDRKARSRQTVPFEIVSEVTCRDGSPRVDIVTRVNNNAEDHRLRALFPTAIGTDVVRVDGHFAVIERKIERPPARNGMPAYPTQHQGRFAAIQDDRGGFAIINDGLPEFEAIREPRRLTLAQTLFRSVGWVSREDFVTRPGLCGPPVAAPEGQCLRPMEFRYGFMAYGNDVREVLREALRHNVAVLSTRCDIHGGTEPAKVGIYDHDPYTLAQPLRPVPREGALPDRASLLDIGNENLVLSAVKKCEARNSLIVRLYNPGGTAEKGRLAAFRPIKAAYATSLNEKRREALKVKDGTVAYNCPAYRILTFELML
jgi:mannosylglycerate hydrolase